MTTCYETVADMFVLSFSPKLRSAQLSAPFKGKAGRSAEISSLQNAHLLLLLLLLLLQALDKRKRTNLRIITE
jgi:hypothetical protein